MVSLKFREVLCVVYSILLFISGLLLIIFSAYLSYKVFYHYTFIPSSTLGPFIVLFLLGFVHLLLTWLGIRGPGREHDFHIILFIAITGFLLVVELSVGIWAMVRWDDADVEAMQLMTKSFGELEKDNFARKDKAWMKLESKLQCCGLNGVSDYEPAKEKPLSCCSFEAHGGNCQIFHEAGCKQPLIHYVKILLIDAAAMGFTCCLLQALGIFLFFTYFRCLKEERKLRLERRVALQRRVSQENGTAANPAAAPVAPPHDA